MKPQPFTIFIALSLAALAGGFWYFQNPAQPSETQSQAQTQPNTNSQTAASPTLLIDINNYMGYSEAVLVNAQQKGQPLLFFAATTWCQTCTALEAEIFERRTEIPSAVTILKVDYDNDTQMNRKWGITAQHTLVLLDQNGQETKRWIGGGFDTLLQEIESI